ncbi:MAG: GGDEF domain-containing protein [Sulfurimonas sp.]|jgi:diguanylate cyclase (GGDEF)-like protein
MQNNKKMAPNLLNIVTNIESGRDKIVSEWIEVPTVKVVFKSYKISAKKFKNGFGIPILEYFIAVVKEEKLPGDCPIMTRLVFFLLEKNITPKDVFDICMGLRRKLISYLYRESLLQNNDLDTMDEIADLFDANLSGVLTIFTKYYQEQQKTVLQSITYQQKLKQIMKIINLLNTKIIIIQNSCIIMGNQSFFDTMGVKDIQEFCQKYENSFSFMRDINCYKELFNIKDMNDWLKKIYESNQSFETKIYNHKNAKEFTYSGRITTLPESDPVQYIVTFNNINSYIEDIAEVRKMINYDELTGLNNYTAFEHILGEIQEQSRKNGTKLALAIVDIPELKRINEEEGRDYGDGIIIEVAECIKSFANDTMTLAHLEGGRFGILMPYKSEQDCYDWCCLLQMKLSTKSERKTVSITAFDLLETVNKVQMRAYNLVETAMSLEDDSVQTDFEYVKIFVNMPDQEQFTYELKQIDIINTTLYYKELPISVSNKILSVNKESITLNLLNKQLLIASDNDAIYLEFPLLGFVKAHIKHVDNINMTMLVHKFSLDNYTPKQRKKFRVAVEKDTLISISYSGQVVNGLVIDVNEDFIALTLKNKKILYEGSLVFAKIMLNLENNIELFHTSATVQKIKTIEDNYKVVLLCHLSSESRALLHRYIAKRQIEIINEMRNKAI